MGEKFKPRQRGKREKIRSFAELQDLNIRSAPTKEELERKIVEESKVYTTPMAPERTPKPIVPLPNWTGNEETPPKKEGEKFAEKQAVENTGEEKASLSDSHEHTQKVLDEQVNLINQTAEGIPVVLHFPKIGINYEGNLSRNVLETMIVPAVRDALLKSGDSQAAADTLINASFYSKESRDKKGDALAKHVERVLHNINSQYPAPAKIEEKTEEREAVEPSSTHVSVQEKQGISIQNRGTWDERSLADIKKDRRRENKLPKVKERKEDEYRLNLLPEDEERPSSYRAKNKDVKAIPITSASAPERTISSEQSDRSLRQMDRLIERTKKMREGMGLSHKEAMSSIEDLHELRSKIRLIRGRQRKLEKLRAEGKSTAEVDAEIQTLRDELKDHLVAFKKLARGNGEAVHTASEENEDKGGIKREIGKTTSMEKLPRAQYEHKTDDERYKADTENRVTKTVAELRRAVPYVPNGLVYMYGKQLNDLSLKGEEIKEALAQAFEEESYGMYGLSNFSPEDKTHIDKLVAEFDAIAEDLKELRDWEKEPEVKKEEPAQRLDEESERELEKAMNEAIAEDEELNESPEVEAEPEEPKSEDAKTSDDEGVKAEVITKYSKSEIFALREDYKNKKAVFDAAYKAHLEAWEKEKRSGIGKIFPFWRKEKKTQSLLDAEQAYSEAREKYAEEVNTALYSRITTRNRSNLDALSKKSESAKALLANRFIINAAHEKLATEKLFVPEGKATRTLAKMQEAIKKREDTIRKIGWATTIAMSMSTGFAGLFYAILGRKGAAIGTVLGGTLAAVGANALYDIALLNPRSRRRGDALSKASTSFSVKNIDALEKEILESSRKYEKAAKNKRAVVGGAAIAGGVLGGMIGGGFDPENIPTVDVTSTDSGGDILNSLEKPVIDQVHMGDATADKDIRVIPIERVDPIQDGTSPVENVTAEESSQEINRVTTIESPESTLETVEAEKASPETAEVINGPSLMYTFEGGDIDTTSEALYDQWQKNPGLLDDALTKNEFLSQMYSAIAEIEKDPELNSEILEMMGITSGDIDKVEHGQTINLQPFFEYMNSN